MKPRLIGVIGEMKSGKDTFYECLRHIHSGFRRYAFADPLKEEVAVACGVTVGEINQNKDRFRLILQWWGTEFRRHNDERYWIRQLENRLNRDRYNYSHFTPVITDVRFPNEAAFVKQRGGILVRVKRPLSWWRQVLRKLGFDRKGHASEWMLREYPADVEILNDGTLGDFKQKVSDWWYGLN